MEMPDLSNALGLEIERMTKHAQQQAAHAAELQQRLAGMVGHAETPDGRVRLSFSPDEGLPELRIDPRAMRLGSDELAETIREVVLQAVRDLERRKRDAAKAAFGDDFDPESARPDSDTVQSALEGISEVVEYAGRDVTALMDRLRGRLEH
jgi:DNA-binding protein YbaB